MVRSGAVTEQQLEKGGYSIYTTFEKKKVDELEKAVQKVYKEKIDPKKRPKTDTHVQFGGASIDTKTGAIKAIYGGEDATKHFTNNADVTGAQVGSTFGPFVLAAAMKWGVRDPDLGPVQAQDERTVVSPKSLYSGKNDLKINNYDGSIWENEKGEQWRQENDGQDSLGDPPDYKIDLREAMRESVNSAFVQLGMDVGLDKVKESAVDAGRLEEQPGRFRLPVLLHQCLGPECHPHGGAYATFAGQRQASTSRSPAHGRVTNRTGTPATRTRSRRKQAFTGEGSRTT